MPITRSLRRLLLVLKMKEEQAQHALENATAELTGLQSTLGSARKRERTGRELIALSIVKGESVDRAAALEEIAAAKRVMSALYPLIDEAERSVAARRDEWLGKRVERKQSETLLAQAERREALQANRRAQQIVDDWFLRRISQNETRKDVRPADGDEKAALFECSDPEL